MALMGLIIACNVVFGIIGWCCGIVSAGSVKKKYLKQIPVSQVKAMYADAYVAGKLDADQVAALVQLLD